MGVGVGLARFMIALFSDGVSSLICGRNVFLDALVPS